MKNKNKSKISLEIRLVNNNLRLSLINQKRFTKYGFGLFLENYNPKEIAITDKARKELLKQKYILGLQPIEFFNNNIIGFCETDFPIGESSVHEGAEKLIEQFSNLNEK